MNLLFLNAGRRVELVHAFRSALEACGGGTIHGSDISDLAPALYAVDQSVLFPHSSAPEFVETLCAYCSEHAIDLLIPTIDPDLVWLDRNRAEIYRHCPSMTLLISPSFTIQVSRHKRLARTLLKLLGSNVPALIPRDAGVERFPAFARPPSGSASKGAGPVTSPEDLRAKLADCPQLLVEELVAGPEYTVDVLCDLQGHALLAVPRRRIKVRGGEVCQGVVERNAELEAQAMRLAEGFECRGPVTVQFRAPEAGVFVPIELNARMGGGLPLTIAAGGDWPLWILRMCAGEAPKIADNVQDRTVMMRFDASFFLAPSRPRGERLDRPTGLKGLLFDLDDTLYPERDFVYSGYRAVAERVMADMGVEIETLLRHRFEAGQRGDLFTLALRDRGMDVDEDYVLELVECYRTHLPQLAPFADVTVLDGLRHCGFALGLVTDGYERVQKNKLDALGLAPRFDAVVLSDALGGRPAWKPAAAPYLTALDALRLAPGDAAYIGDNPAKDFLGANRLGMTTIRIRRRGGEHEFAEPPCQDAAPDFEIDSLAELGELLSVQLAVAAMEPAAILPETDHPCRRVQPSADFRSRRVHRDAR